MKSLVVLNECMFDAEQRKRLYNEFEKVDFYEDTNDENTAIQRIQDRNIIIMDQFLWTFSEKLFKECKNLELIVLNTTAYDNIPLELLKKYNVKLANLKTYATQDVAEVAVSMMMALNCNLNLATKIASNRDLTYENYHQNEIVSDIWPGHPVIPYLKRHQLNKLKAGIVGLGNIGQAIADLCQRIGMNTIAFNRNKKDIEGVEMVSLEKLFEQADVIFISLKYQPKKMEKVISKNLLNSAKEGSIFVSIAPLELIDIEHLISIQSKFKGIGLDCFATENLVKQMKGNFIITPHLGHQSYEAYTKMTESIIDTIIDYSKNNPINLVSL
ncbi:MAG TPA: NAD(P)-dependent oxidoreductase [Candidatus Woesebacteria bacterium]|nr:NAD(P)-dependent oxidoreductase [Candidatus Woesebacteria bacterium]